MDQVLQSWGNEMRKSFRIAGAMYQSMGEMMHINPFTAAFGDQLENIGRFLEVKNQPVSAYPWMTENEIVHTGLRVALRKFNRGTKGNPVLLVPPEAGHNSQIVDYGPGQSLVQCALGTFNGDVYVMEKLPASPEDVDYSIDDCIRSVDECIRHIGRPVHLVGLCQGGWQSAIYTALFPEKVTTLTLAAAPIDFHAGDALITRWARSLPKEVYHSMVAVAEGLMPGAFIVTGFMMMNPVDRFWGDDLKLFQKIEDSRYVERYKRFNRWYRFTQSLPGRMYLQVVEDLFRENKLVQGRLEVLGRKVDLSRIYQPLYLIAGSKDDITPFEQLFAIHQHASSIRVEEIMVPAGHIGVFMASQVIKETWTDIFKRLSNFTGDEDFAIDLETFEKEQSVKL